MAPPCLAAAAQRGTVIYGSALLLGGMISLVGDMAPP